MLIVTVGYMLIVVNLFLGGTLEIGAQWAIEQKDTEGFERYMAQLKPYYLDYRLE